MLVPGILSADPLPAQTSTGVVLRGRVVDAVTRAPIPGAEITGGGQPAVVSDERGGFALPMDGQPPLALQVQVPGYLPRTVEVRDLGRADRLEIALERAPGYAEQLVVTGPPPAPPEPAQEVSAQAVADTPGAFEDGMQALKSLPGVISRDDWSGRLYVRGGRPDQNGIYLDGIPVYDPYRVFGLTSLFNPETLESLTLYPGGFDVRYGDRLSAVIAGESRTGTVDTPFAGSANISLTNANLRAEGSLGLGFPSSWLVSARRTYFDLVATDEDIPSFADLQARILLEPSSRHRLTLTVLGSQEETDLTADDQEFDGLPDNHVEAGDTQQNLVFGLQGRHLFSDWLRLHYVASRTSDTQTSDVFYREGETGFETRADQDLEAATTTLRAWVESTLGRHTLELGGEVSRSENTVGFHLDTNDPRVDIPDSIKSFDEREDYSRFGAFAQDTFALARDLELKAGVRWAAPSCRG
ncbi:MAG TPA: TonB-dependent receptor [Thermoanaerobaculaceae bacterium]|nr:TonB-dependent receptor [Thermoanaerobaculaceae bacterium]